MASLPNFRLLNGWSLFAVVVALTALCMIGIGLTVDLQSREGAVSMIQYSVKLSAPWLFLAFAASSIHQLYRSGLSRYLMKNRRFVGLCFSAGMAWQLISIFWLLHVDFQYYLTNFYDPIGTGVQATGYASLLAMTITSIGSGRSVLPARLWRYLHKAGMYVLWVIVAGTYVLYVVFLDRATPINVVFASAGALVMILRTIAWSQSRLTRSKKTPKRVTSAV